MFKPQTLKGFLLIFTIPVILFSCSSTRSVQRPSGRYEAPKHTNASASAQAKKILAVADSYLKTPYKYGGFSRSGMDCSGLVYMAFQSENITMPRISKDQATVGREIPISQVLPGDLLYFATGGSAQINHTGIVHDIGADGEIHFIHSSTSRGVMISSMDLDYWKKAFRGARRIL